MDFPSRLKILIKISGLTRDQFSNCFGISSRQLFNYLGGQSEPTVSFFIKLKSEFPQVDLNWLIKGEEEVEASTDLIERYNKNKKNSDGKIFLEAHHLRPNYETDPAPINLLLGHINNVLKEFTEDQQKDVLKYAEERKLLSDLMAEKNK